MIIVHHLEKSRSQRIVWLREERGIPYEIEHYKRDPNTMLAPEALRRVHPLGAADVQMSFPLQAAGARANLDALPHIRDFIQRVEARPAYQRGIERTGPLELLG